MVKKYIFLAGLFTTVSIASAQIVQKDLTVGLGFVKSEYNGDYGNGVFKFNGSWYPEFSLSLNKYISPTFDLGFQSSYGNYGYHVTNIEYFAGLKFDASVYLHYKFNNGSLLSEDSRFSPFLSLGAGLAAYSINSTIDFSKTNSSLAPTIVVGKPDFIIPFGAGVTYQLNNSFSIQYQYLYNITSSDVHDQDRGSIFPNPKSGNDAYGQHILSIFFTISTLNKKCRCDTN